MMGGCRGEKQFRGVEGEPNMVPEVLEAFQEEGGQ